MVMEGAPALNVHVRELPLTSTNAVFCSPLSVSNATGMPSSVETAASGFQFVALLNALLAPPPSHVMDKPDKVQNTENAHAARKVNRRMGWKREMFFI